MSSLTPQDAAWLREHILGEDGRCLIGQAGDGVGGADAGGHWLRLDKNNRVRIGCANRKQR